MGSREAQHVFILMKRDYRVSRNVRASWYFQHLNKPILQANDAQKFSDDLEIIGVLPNAEPSEFLTQDETNPQKYIVTPSTVVTFLAKRYRLVFLLDLSPSLAVVDVTQSQVLYEKVFEAFQKSLINITKPFSVPGGSIIYSPEIYITVVAHTPFLSSYAEQVLLQGVLITQANVMSHLSKVRSKLKVFEDVEAKTVSQALDQMDFAKYRFNTGAPIKQKTNLIPETTMVTPDTSVVNLLRKGILALQLLPENTSAGLITITDGVVGIPDFSILQSLLVQLRNATVMCSFIQVRSGYHPNCTFGHVSYMEFLQFLATATFGAFLSASALHKKQQPGSLNMFHKAMLCWTFQRALLNRHRPLIGTAMNIRNPDFLADYGGPLLRKRILSAKIEASLANILSVRLREGYTIKQVTINEAESSIEVNFLLPYAENVNLEYQVTTDWPFSMDATSHNSSAKIELVVEAPYEFLVDMKSPPGSFRSPFRMAVVQSFHDTIEGLRKADKLLVHLHSFSTDPAFYTVPDSVRSGVPLFYLPPNQEVPVVCSREQMQNNSKFISFWRPVCNLDINIWQKWLHTHRIGIILEHDSPIPKLHLPAATSNRHPQIQCRQASSALHELLNKWATFTLMENHSYITLVSKDKMTCPGYFYIIRTIFKPPCVIIKFAFLGGTEGHERNEIVSAMREKLLAMTIEQRKESSALRHGGVTPRRSRQHLPTVQMPACVLLIKPVEKIFIRYDRLPTNFMSIVDYDDVNRRPTAEDHNIPNFSHTIRANSSIYNTLAKYLHPKRWIWSLKRASSGFPVSSQVASQILQVLTRRRLNEGFHFALASNGIINLVQEFAMKPLTCPEKPHDCDHVTYHCVVQYILFPPTLAFNGTNGDSSSEAEESEINSVESDSEVQLVTEAWVEPQSGRVIGHRHPYYSGVEFLKIPKKLFEADSELIKVMVTYEHLYLMFRDGNRAMSPVSPSVQKIQKWLNKEKMALPESDNLLKRESPIRQIPSCFDLLTLLSHSQVACLIFSTLSYTASDAHDAMNRIFLDLFNGALTKADTKELDMCCITSSLRCGDMLRSTWSHIIQRIYPLAASSLVLKMCISNLNARMKRPDSLPQLKCYVQLVADDRLIIIFVPETIEDVLMINSGHRSGHRTTTQTLLKNSLEVLSESGDECDSEATLIKESHSLTSFSMKRTRSFNVPEPPTGSDYNSEFPIFVFNAYYPHLTARLSSGIKLKHSSDIVEDFSSKSSVSELSLLHRMVSRVSESESRIREEFFQHPLLDMPVEEAEDFSFTSYCNWLETIYSETFVKVVYKGILTGWSPSPIDIAAVVDGKCEEFLVEVPMTEFIRIVCKHAQEFRQQCANRGTLRRCNTFDTEASFGSKVAAAAAVSGDISSSTCFLDALLQEKPCGNAVHQQMEREFATLVSRYFRPVPSSPDYFYLRREEGGGVPLPQADRPEVTVESASEKSEESDDDGSSISFERNDTTEDLGTGGMEINFSEQKDSKVTFDIQIGPDNRDSPAESSWRSPTPKRLQQDDNLRGSTESFESRHRHESGEEQLMPLFVQLACSLRHCGDVHTFSIRSLPSCLLSLLNRSDMSGDLDLEYLDITLDIVALTLPTDGGTPDDNHLVNLRKTSVHSLSSSQDVDSDMVSSVKSKSLKFGKRSRNEMDSSESLDKLCDMADGIVGANQLALMSETHREVVQRFTLEVENFFENEVAFALRLSDTITSATLQAVVNQVELSSARDCPSGLMSDVSLTFVQNDEESMRKFREKLGDLRIGCWQFEQSDDFYYATAVEPTSPTVIEGLLGESQSIFLSVESNGMRGRSATNECDIPPSLRDKQSGTDAAHGVCHTRQRSNSEPLGLDISAAVGVNDDVSTNLEESFSQNVSTSVLGSDDGRSASEFWLILHLTPLNVRVVLLQRPGQMFDEVYHSTIAAIQKLCATVNQHMLLETLDATKVCDSLLIAESDEYHWREKKQSISSDGGDTSDTLERPELGGYLLAHSQFKPGSFSCPCVWYTHFLVHPRLKSVSAGSVSKAVAAMKALLLRFVVTNRHNVFVYRETSGNVFYMELHDNFMSARPHIADCCELEGMKDETLLTVRPKSSLDRLRHPTDFVYLTVHGINAPGPEIKVEFVKALQAKLDDSVLIALCETLRRNPNSKLSEADVEFIQPLDTKPNSVLHFSVPLLALQHLFSLHYYLTRQHLSLFTSRPNYMVHTKRFRVFQELDPDAEIFLYNRPAESGGKGICCCSCSFVDIKGTPISLVRSDPIDPNGYQTFFGPNLFSFDALTKSKLVDPAVLQLRMGAGVVPLVQFALWERGNAGLENFKHRLHLAVRHALSDVISERGILVAPCMESLNCPSDSFPASEPVSPTEKGSGDSKEVRKRHSSAAIVLPVGMRRESKTRFTFDSIQAISRKTSAVPSLFSFDSADRLAYGGSNAAIASGEFNNRLHQVYCDTSSAWFDFVLRLGNEVVRKFTFHLHGDFSLHQLVGELYALLRKSLHETDVICFCKNNTRSVPGGPVVYETYTPPKPFQPAGEIANVNLLSSPNIAEERRSNDFIIVGQSLKLWTDTVKLSNDPKFESASVAYLMAPKGRQMQMFLPLVPKSEYQTSNASDISDTQCFSDSQVFVPRQRLLFLKLVDRELTLFTYNWSKEVSIYMEGLLSRLVQWQNARVFLLREICLHKLGLHRLAVPREEERRKNPIYLPARWIQSDVFISHLKPLQNLPKLARPDPAYKRLLRPYRDPTGEIWNFSLVAQRCHEDPLLIHGLILADLRTKLRSTIECRLTLQGIFQSLTRDTLIAQPVVMKESVLMVLVEQSRLVHFVYTPLLFHPSWRERIALVRCPGDAKFTFPTPTSLRSRHSSGQSQHAGAAPLSPPLVQKTFAASRDAWHVTLQQQFCQQYVQYLQHLGFRLILVETLDGQRSGGLSPADPLSPIQSPESWLELSCFGGIILLHIGFLEPFFVFEFFSCDSSLMVPGEQVDFKELKLFNKKIKETISASHVHSFSFDFHLRTVHLYLSEKHAIFRPGYHTNAFLNDFLSYYSCRPSYARTYLHEDICHVSGLNTAPDTLYNYLLDHCKQYGLTVIKMRVPSAGSAEKQYLSEYLLVAFGTYTHSYVDSTGETVEDNYDTVQLILQDTSEISPSPSFVQGNQMTSNKGGVRRILSENASSNSLDSATLRLKFYLIFINAKEKFPRRGANESEGQYCRVPTGETPSDTPSEVPSPERSPKKSHLRSASLTAPDLSYPNVSSGQRTTAGSPPNVQAAFEVRKGTSMSLSPTKPLRSASSDDRSCTRPLYLHIDSEDSSSNNFWARVSPGVMSNLPSQRKLSRFSVEAVNDKVQEDEEVYEETMEYLQQPQECMLTPTEEILGSDNSLTASGQSTVGKNHSHSLQRAMRRNSSRRSRRSTCRTMEESSLQPEVVNYLTFVGVELSSMQTAVESEAQETKLRLKELLSEAMQHCRRDSLWQKLMTGVQLETDTRLKDPGVSPAISFGEFEELLSCTSSKALLDMDPSLKSLFEIPTSWHSSITKLVTGKYGEHCRLLTSPEVKRIYLAVLNANSLDNFLLMSFDFIKRETQTTVVFRDINTRHTMDTADKSHFRELAVFRLCEDFVNLLIYHLWTRVLP